jgi:hypothetical protein
MKRYKFQALVTLGSPRDGHPAAMRDGLPQRLVLRGQRHETGTRKVLRAGTSAAGS